LNEEDRKYLSEGERSNNSAREYCCEAKLTNLLVLRSRIIPNNPGESTAARSLDRFSELCTTNSKNFKKTKRNIDYNSFIGKAKVNKEKDIKTFKDYLAGM